VGKAILAEAVYDVERSDRKIFPAELTQKVQDIIRNKGLLRNVDRLIAALFFDSMPRECVGIERIEQVWPVLALCNFLERLDAKNLVVRAAFCGARAENVSQAVAKGDLGAFGANFTSLCDESTGGDGSLGGSPERCMGIIPVVDMHAGAAHRHAAPDDTGIRRMMVVLVGDGTQELSAAVDGSNKTVQRWSLDNEHLLLSHVILYRTHDVDPFEKKLGSAVRRTCAKA
jgi:hypothetical protein